MVLDKTMAESFSRVSNISFSTKFTVDIKLPGFYTLNAALQDIIGQPQFEMTFTFRVSKVNVEVDITQFA